MHIPKLIFCLSMVGAAATYFLGSYSISELQWYSAMEKSNIEAAKKRAKAEISAALRGARETSVHTVEVTSLGESSSLSETQNASAAKTGADTYSRMIEPTLHGKSGQRPRLDIAFCIDTTASMQGEIDTVKSKVKSMVTQLAQSHKHPLVRVGLVAYRDKGDDYLTKIFPFSDDINKVEQDIADLRAEGGGDGPEAVESGVHDAIHRLDWSASKKCGKLIFLIGDAPSHTSCDEVNWDNLIEDANVRGIHVNTFACAGLEGYKDQGIPLYQKIAMMTNGNFEQLSYHQTIVDTKGTKATLITSGGKSYVMKSTTGEDWKKKVDTLVATGSAAPALQGATNGTLGVAGSDATYITGVNTAGSVRTENNLDTLMKQGAESLMDKIGL